MYNGQYVMGFKLVESFLPLLKNALFTRLCYANDPLA